MNHEQPQKNATVKWVRIPIITSDTTTHSDAKKTPPTALRRRSTVPTRLGPWPLKRSLSEDDRMSEATVVIKEVGSRNDYERSHPTTLASVLSSIDEECRTIDQALKLEATMIGTVTDSEQQTSLRGSNKTVRDRQLAASVFLVMLAVGMVAMFVSVPIMTFVFAQPSWGGIQLQAQAPSRTVFGAILGTMCFPIGMVWPIAIASVVSAKKGWPVLTRKNAAIVAGSSVAMGAVLTGWMLAWVLPLISRAEHLK